MDMKDFNELLKARNDAERTYFKRCSDVFQWVKSGMNIDCNYVKDAIRKAEVAELALESAERDFDELFKHEAMIATYKEN